MSQRNRLVTTVAAILFLIFGIIVSIITDLPGKIFLLVCAVIIVLCSLWARRKIWKSPIVRIEIAKIDEDGNKKGNGIFLDQKDVGTIILMFDSKAYPSFDSVGYGEYAFFTYTNKGSGVTLYPTEKGCRDIKIGKFIWMIRLDEENSSKLEEILQHYIAVR